MSRRRRAIGAVRAIDVPTHVVLLTIAIWLFVGTATSLHFDAFELPANYALFVGWVAGGFASAFFYLLFVCE